MKLSFTHVLFVGLAFVHVASPSPSNDEEDDRHEIPVRRYLTEDDDAECVLYLTEIEDSERWNCRFTKEQAEELGIPAEMGIEGVPEEFFESAISGGTIVKFGDGAFIKQDPFAAAASNNNISVGTVMVPRAASAEVRDLSNDDPRHYLNCRKTKGNFRTLVVRIIDSLDKEPVSAETLRSKIFTNSLNMKTQFEACSQGQMIIEEAGIVDVKVDVPLNYDTNERDFGAVAKAAAEAKYGGNAGLEAMYDLVMFCFPPGKIFGAWTNLNSFDSYYSDVRYMSPSVQMHEIGHNLGLKHSMANGEEYGDRSSLMGDIGGEYGDGSSFLYTGEEEGPHCFNPANNYQLRWYEKQQLSIKPLELQTPRTFVLNGVNDYRRDGSSVGELVVLRLEYYGSETEGWDFYVGYNRATGINRGVNAKPEYVDTVTVVMKLGGGMYGNGKTERWDIPVGKSYTINRPVPDVPDVYIDFRSIHNGGKDAIVVISNSQMIGLPTTAPSMAPTMSSTNTMSSTFTMSPTAWLSPTVPPTMSPTMSPTVSSPTV